MSDGPPPLQRLLGRPPPGPRSGPQVREGGVVVAGHVPRSHRVVTAPSPSLPGDTSWGVEV